MAPTPTPFHRPSPTTQGQKLDTEQLGEKPPKVRIVQGRKPMAGLESKENSSSNKKLAAEL